MVVAVAVGQVLLARMQQVLLVEMAEPELRRQLLDLR
jgi:hypothetical protein